MSSLRFAVRSSVVLSVFLAAGAIAQPIADREPSLLPPAVATRFDAGAESVNLWVYVRDKGTPPASLPVALAELQAASDPACVHRRQLRRSAPGLFDERDLPIPGAYLDAIRDTGATVRQQSRWLAAVSVRADRAAAERLARLDFVDRLELVRGGRGVRPVELAPAGVPGPYTPRDFYGASSEQLNQINLPALHQQGYTGQGVIIGILDTGFQRGHDVFNQPGHVVNVIAEHDFINNDDVTSAQPGDPDGQYVHGTLILGCIGAYQPNTLVGGAYNASFVLCKTENVASETPIEEDNYVAGLEFIEMHGGDVATSSLGYIDWYTQANLNGVTAVTSVAVNVATENGLHCCTAAGNEGHDDNPATSHLIAPADALKVITCGAGRADGTSSSFTSDGPTADGRIKPEILARGSGTWTVDPNSTTALAQASGTSLSTPLVAAAVACLVQAHPTWSVDQLRLALFATGSDFAVTGSPDPLFVRGYGFVNAAGAAGFTCSGDYNLDGNVDQGDVSSLIDDIASGRAAPPPFSTDITNDGNADQTDVDALINLVAGGGCP